MVCSSEATGTKGRDATGEGPGATQPPLTALTTGFDLCGELHAGVSLLRYAGAPSEQHMTG